MPVPSAGFWSAVLAKQGHEVGLIARGDHLAALKAEGCTLESDDDRFTVHPACSDNPADFGPQDFVIVTVKAPTMPSVADGVASLLGPTTAVVTAMNGVPWWFSMVFQKKGPGHHVCARSRRSGCRCDFH